MKAIRVHQSGSPDVMRLEEVPDPTPAAGQVLVEVKAVGVNPVETYIRAGIYPAQTPLPYTPGGDAAGVIRAVGSDVKALKAGDRVYTAGTISGAYAELALCKQEQVHRLPDSITFQQGAGVNVPYATAWRAIFLRGHAMPGETILVHGASGGVGIAAVQIAKSAGMTVHGTAGSERGLKLVADQGADHVWNHKEPNYLKQILDTTEGRGLNIILEMLANVNLNNDLDVLAKHGRVVVIGSRGPVQIDPRKTMGKDSSILGMSVMNATAEELFTIHSALRAGLSDGTLRPIIGREFALKDAPAAHELVMSAGAYGKIVLIP
jgi:NADPH2:quinone reductase